MEVLVPFCIDHLILSSFDSHSFLNHCNVYVPLKYLVYQVYFVYSVHGSLLRAYNQALNVLFALFLENVVCVSNASSP